MQKLLEKLLLTLLLYSPLGISNHFVSAQSQVVAESTLSPQAEIQVLEAQLQLMESYQDRFLSTVYWALGTVATLALVLVGFGWLVNFRLYEREKAALSQELENSLREKSATLEVKLNEQLLGALNDIPKHIEQAIKSEVGLLNRKITEIDRTLLETEHETQIKENRFYRALRAKIQMLELENRDGGNPYFIGDILDDVITDLRQVIENKQQAYIYADEIARIQDAIRIHEKTHGIVVSSIYKLLAQLRGA